MIASLAAAAAAGAIVELVVIRRLYDRDHLDQVLATFALILMFSEGTRWLFGSFPLYLDIPPLLQGAVALPTRKSRMRLGWRAGVVSTRPRNRPGLLEPNGPTGRDCAAPRGQCELL